MKILDIFQNPSNPVRAFERPYIIAEAGVNHEGSMDIARRLIEEAKEGGADAIKFQAYKADTLASRNSPAYWDTTKEKTQSQHELFSKHDKFWKSEMELLKQYCDSSKIEFLCTPFDFRSAEFLDDLVPAFKISSSDITNKPFIEHVSGFNKPIILSTGASELWEIHEAVSWIDSHEVPVSLLHCVLNYPTDDADANLGMIIGLKEAFRNRIIGYSDHTLPGDMRVCEMAAIMGSRIIEKHFTHDKTLPGNDHYHAMDMGDLALFRKRLDEIANIVGTTEVKSIPSEEIARRNARRSMIAARKISKGAKIQSEDLTFKRPAFGISPRSINDIIDKVAIEDINEDTVLQWSMFKD